MTDPLPDLGLLTQQRIATALEVSAVEAGRHRAATELLVAETKALRLALDKVALQARTANLLTAQSTPPNAKYSAEIWKSLGLEVPT